MRIVCLVENTSNSANIKSKHGLSFYIESGQHKILFDLGSDDLFLKNAEKLGVDISAVDTLIISHGHDDHGGALGIFLDNNTKAKIYIRSSAFNKHAAKVLFKYIGVGLNHKFKDNPRIVFTEDIFKIDDELLLFVSKNRDFKPPSANNTLYKLADNNKYIKDDFCHEQSLVINSNNKTVLLGGCAHSGIVNIINTATEITGKNMDVIISGFHLYNPATKRTVPKRYISALEDELKKYNTIFYTCHCTGKKAFSQLKETLGDNFGYISAGAELSI